MAVSSAMTSRPAARAFFSAGMTESFEAVIRMPLAPEAGESGQLDASGLGALRRAFLHLDEEGICVVLGDEASADRVGVRRHRHDASDDGKSSSRRE